MHLSFGLVWKTALVTSMLVGSSYASGSKEKTPEEAASDSVKQSTAAYNNGVKRIDHAKKMGEKGDSTFSFNYRAVTDDKVRHEFEEAVKDLQKALALNPDFKEADNNLGYCYRKLGKLNESLAAYDKAIALDSNFAQAREYRGETYLALDRPVDAQHELAFLQAMKSPFADQLAHSMDLYKLWEAKEDATSPDK